MCSWVAQLPVCSCVAFTQSLTPKWLRMAVVCVYQNVSCEYMSVFSFSTCLETGNLEYTCTSAQVMLRQTLNASRHPDCLCSQNKQTCYLAAASAFWRLTIWGPLFLPTILVGVISSTLPGFPGTAPLTTMAPMSGRTFKTCMEAQQLQYIHCKVQNAHNERKGGGGGGGGRNFVWGRVGKWGSGFKYQPIVVCSGRKI